MVVIAVKLFANCIKLHDPLNSWIELLEDSWEEQVPKEGHVA
jgi:hypothetical protein